MSQGTAMSVKQSRVLRSKAGRRITFLRAVAAVAYERAAVRSVHERATERLRQASAQRLRHTADSHMMDRQVDLRCVRDNLGHESSRRPANTCMRTTTIGIVPRRPD
jgi:site-specific recombinase XerC